MLSEQNNFLDVFRAVPTELKEVTNALAPSLDNAVLWVDNTSAINTAKDTRTKPKSRHYALRYLRVRDNCDKIMYCPTNLMKADALTKLECSVSQRRLVLHHIPEQDMDNRDDTYDECFV